jgi:hypothetical protein
MLLFDYFVSRSRSRYDGKKVLTVVFSVAFLNLLLTIAIYMFATVRGDLRSELILSISLVIFLLSLITQKFLAIKCEFRPIELATLPPSKVAHTPHNLQVRLPLI